MQKFEKIVKQKQRPGIYINWISQGTPENKGKPIAPGPPATKVTASVTLSAMLKLGKLIQPKVDIVCMQLEEYILGQTSFGEG